MGIWVMVSHRSGTFSAREGEWLFSSDRSGSQTYFIVNAKQTTVLLDLPLRAAEWFVNDCKAGKKELADLTNDNIPSIIKAYNNTVPPDQAIPLPRKRFSPLDVVRNKARDLGLA